MRVLNHSKTIITNKLSKILLIIAIPILNKLVLSQFKCCIIMHVIMSSYVILMIINNIIYLHTSYHAPPLIVLLVDGLRRSFM